MLNGIYCFQNNDEFEEKFKIFSGKIIIDIIRTTDISKIKDECERLTYLEFIKEKIKLYLSDLDNVDKLSSDFDTIVFITMHTLKYSIKSLCDSDLLDVFNSSQISKYVYFIIRNNLKHQLKFYIENV
jgi:NAD-specific glutamate dehydrogenase